MEMTEQKTLISRKSSSRHEGCDVVLYHLGPNDYVTWIENVSLPEYSKGYTAWGHYFPSLAQAQQDFDQRD